MAEIREVDADQEWMNWADDAYLVNLPKKWSLSRVVEVEGKVVGYALCSEKDDVAWLHRLVVSPENRGSGIGALLLRDVEKTARAQGYARVGLKTPVDNFGARKFYEEAGYTEQYRNSGLIHMSKILSPGVVGVHQPNYIPWLGYFYKLSRSDMFVILDDVQAPSRGYVNRSKVLVQGAGRWLTVPVNRNDGIIRHMTAANEEWVSKHLATLKHNYQKAPHYDDLMPELREIFQNRAGERLSLFNEKIIAHVASLLSIDTPVVRSSRFQVETTGDKRLVDLVRAVGGGAYLSGSGGDKYQMPETFLSEGLDLRYTAFESVRYPQQGTGEFVPGLSVLDALFNIGPDATREIIDRSPEVRQADVRM